MKTFEEKFTAWVDGRLTGAELAAFERELDEHPDALAEKEAALEIGNLLRTHLPSPPLKNADFFNHQLLRQIAQSAPAAPGPRASRRFFWSLPRMAYSGAFLLLLSTALYFAAVPNTRREVRHHEQYVSNIVSGKSKDPDVASISNIVDVRSDDPHVTATAFHSKGDDVNVIWLDGLSYLPQDHKLK
jgi:anti-sigma factor RsiW